MNTQEKEPEMGDGVFSAEFWMYDGKLGRRWNMDPIYKFYESPYSCFGNNPNWIIDIGGDDTIYASRSSDTGKWEINTVKIASGNDIFRITYGNYSRQFEFTEGEYGKRMNILNLENTDDHTLGIYHISGQDGEGSVGFVVTPGGEPSTKVNSNKRLPDDTYTIKGTGNGSDHSSYLWVQPLISSGKASGYVGSRGVKVHPAPSKNIETVVKQWTLGCYVVSTDYSIVNGQVVFNSKLSMEASKKINTFLGATKNYTAVGKKKRPGSDFKNGISFKLIQKTGFQ